MLLLQLLLTLYVFQIKMQWHESCNWIPIFFNILVSPRFLWWETYIYNHYYCRLWEHLLKWGNIRNTYCLLEWYNLLQMYILVLTFYYHNDNYIHFHHNTLYTYFFSKGHEQLFCGEFIPNNYTMALWTQMKIYKIKMRCNNILDPFYWLYKA